MKRRSRVTEGLGIAIILGAMLSLAGCYTMLSHPTVAQEELVADDGRELSGASCTDCHNNEYDHNRMSPHYWGFGSWGIRSNPYGYYGYTGWQHYYYDPWWWGYQYYNPYPYSPYYPPGGGGSGSGSGYSSSPSRDQSRRGLQEAPGSISQPPTPAPVYNPPASSPQTGGGSSGGGQQNNDNNDSNGRGGRRGS